MGSNDKYTDYFELYLECGRIVAIPPSCLSTTLQEGLQETITYFRNHHHQRHYTQAQADHLSIGLGGTEAECKVIIKTCLCAAGMKWKEQGAAIVVLSLRTLSYSQGRWRQFWSKINQYGFDLADV